jgi:hypothetical protein
VVDLLMAGIGIGGSLAALAVLIFVAIAVGSVFFGEKLDLANLGSDKRGVPQGVLRLPPQAHTGETAEKAHDTGTPGTVILVFVFLAVFILYYFTNWKVLSMIWKMG